MSTLREQAVQMMDGLSNDDMLLLLALMRRMTNHAEIPDTEEENGEELMQAFLRLEKARKEIQQYYPEGIDPEQELAEALRERYGCAG